MVVIRKHVSAALSGLAKIPMSKMIRLEKHYAPMESLPSRRRLLSSGQKGIRRTSHRDVYKDSDPEILRRDDLRGSRRGFGLCRRRIARQIRSPQARAHGQDLARPGRQGMVGEG